MGGRQDAGSAHTFERSLGGPNNWGERQWLTASDGAAKDWFGRAADIGTDTVIVSAYGDDDLAENSGSAYVFSLNVPVVLGDVSCDGLIDFGDINPFVQILSNTTGWRYAHPGCPFLNGDINEDGAVDFGDINPFVSLLAGL